MTYQIENSELVVGRNGVCDGYLRLRGKLDAKNIQDSYYPQMSKPMHTTLRELQVHEYTSVCTWAMQENWYGLVKGEVITQEDFPKILALPGHLSFALGEGASSALGFGQIWLSPNGRANLVRILVDPAMRGRGLGKQLYALLLAEALRIPNITQVFLRVRKDNRPAVATYRSLGFQDMEGEGNADVLAMAYRL